MQENSILVPQTSMTEAGFPQVSWVQQMAVTSKGMQDIRTFAKRSAIVVAIAVLLFAISGPGEAWIGLNVLVWGLIIVALKSGPPRGWIWKDWAKKPVTVDCQATAFIEKQDDTLYFAWRFFTPEGLYVGDNVPLESFSIFEVGKLSDWITSPQDEVQYESGQGVFIHVQGVGPRCVAVHYGALAELSALHDHLTAAFINQRPALLKRNRPPPAPVARDPDSLPATL